MKSSIELRHVLYKLKNDESDDDIKDMTTSTDK